jgi:acetyl esterase/lipase
MKVIEDIFYTRANSPMQSLDVYLPDCESFPVVIYFHYGGFTGGDKKGYKFIPYLVERGIAVISANYRLYPEASFPDFIRDGAMVVNWAKKHMPEYGNVTGYFIGGSSAGGYLSMLLCFDKKYLKMHKIDSDEIDGYIMDAGQPTTHFTYLKYDNMDPRKVVVDARSPLYHVRKEGAPLLIICTDNDLENRLMQTQLWVHTLQCYEYESPIRFEIPHGYDHGSYFRKEESGHSVFFNVTSDFITSTEANA